MTPAPSTLTTTTARPSSPKRYKRAPQPVCPPPEPFPFTNTDKAYPDLADLEWHTITTDETIRRLSTSVTHGLSQDQIQRRTEQFGKNVPAPPETHRFKQWFGYFFKGFGSILFVGAILVFIAWKPLGEPPAQANLALAIVLVLVFGIQAAFNMWQDFSTSRVMASIKNMIPDECLVVRDGVQVSVMAADIVPGDVLLIKAGNKLPADVRFVQVSSDARFDRSILTGKGYSNAVDWELRKGQLTDMDCVIQQVNPSHWPPLSNTRTRTTSRPRTLGFKVPTAPRAPARALWSPRLTAPSLVVSPSSPTSPRRG